MNSQLTAAILASIVIGSGLGVAISHTSRVIEGHAVAASGANVHPPTVQIPLLNGAYRVTYDESPGNVYYIDGNGKASKNPPPDVTTFPGDSDIDFWAFKSACIEVRCDSTGVELDRNTHTTALIKDDTSHGKFEIPQQWVV